MDQDQHATIGAPVTRSIGLALFLGLLAISASAQDREDLMSDAMSTSPGRDRAVRLVEIAAKERVEGHAKYAVEFAMLGSAEAERHGLETEMASAQLELARAHMIKGDHESAIAACVRVTKLPGAIQNGLHAQAKLQMAEIYLDSGHPQVALQHLAAVGSKETLSGTDRQRYMRTEILAKKEILTPKAAIPYCNTIMTDVVEMNDTDLHLQVLSLLASSQARTGAYEEAIVTENQVFELAVGMDRAVEAGHSANKLGELYQLLGRTDDAIKALLKGYSMVESIPDLRTGMEVAIAYAHARDGHVDAGVRSIEKAVKTARKEGDSENLTRLLRTAADLRQMQGKVSTALEQALEALTIAESTGDVQEQAADCALLSSLYQQSADEERSHVYKKREVKLRNHLEENRKQDKLAHESLLIELQQIEREQIDLMNRDQNRETRMKQLALDAENHEKELALLRYEKQFEAAARREASFAKDQAHKELDLAKAALEAERQERKIQDLDNTRMLQSLGMARLEAEQKERQRHMELLEERAQLVEAESRTLIAESEREKDVQRFAVAITIGAVLVAVLLFGAWLSARRKKRTIWHQNQKIRGINESLAEKDNNIQSSLSYAQTIQSAILPSEAALQSALPNSFMYYQPLDKVSGDLPFVRQVGDTVYLAAIDCTGHGVPAAMMTFIAYYGLNDLITNDPAASCGELLDRLHEHVKKTMGEREDSVLYNDGMDIGLCRIDMRTGRLTFSGAQLSLFMVRNERIIRLKGDILPLGDDQFERKSGYKEHLMDLLPGDSIFLFSDGIIHQFGGPDGRKKLSMKKLMELMAASSRIDLPEMKAKTAKLFQDWKGDTPQTDDVLLIGMRYAA